MRWYHLVGRVAYCVLILLSAVLVGLFMVNEDMMGAFHGLANKLLTFNCAVIGIFVVEQLLNWFHKFKSKRGLDHVEENPMAAAVYLAGRSVALCFLAAAIFGSV
jgi:hypothetical protein